MVRAWRDDEKTLTPFGSTSAPRTEQPPEFFSALPAKALSSDSLTLRKFAAHVADRPRIVVRAEHRRTGHEHIGARRRNLRDVRRLHPAIHFDQQRTTRALHRRVHALAQHRATSPSVSGMNARPPKPGFTDITSTTSSRFDHMVEHRERRDRIQRESDARPAS